MFWGRGRRAGSWAEEGPAGVAGLGRESKGMWYRGGWGKPARRKGGKNWKAEGVGVGEAVG